MATSSDIAVTTSAGCIAVDAPEDIIVMIATVSGAVITTAHGSTEVAVAPGFYIVHAGNKTAKVYVK